MVAVWNWAARARLFSLPGYNWTLRRTCAEDGTELEEELRSQNVERLVKLGAMVGMMCCVLQA